MRLLARWWHSGENNVPNRNSLCCIDDAPHPPLSVLSSSLFGVLVAFIAIGIIIAVWNHCCCPCHCRHRCRHPFCPCHHCPCHHRHHPGCRCRLVLVVFVAVWHHCHHCYCRCHHHRHCHCCHCCHRCHCRHCRHRCHCCRCCIARGSTRENAIFHVAPGPFLSSSIHSNSSQYDPCKVWLKKNDHFLTCSATKVHICVCTSDWTSDWPVSIRDWPCTGTSKAVDHLWSILTSLLDIYTVF